MTETTTLDPATMNLQGAHLYVRLVDTELELPSGIVLPETARENQTDAEVLAVGPGKVWGSGLTQQVWAGVGSRVVFNAKSFEPFSGDGRSGFLRDEELLAEIYLDGGISPLNDWLLVEPAPAEGLKSSLLVTPDEYKRTATHGRVISWGYGKLQVKGPLAGSRIETPRVLGVTAEELLDATVEWDPRAEVVYLTDDTVSVLLVKVDSILAILE
jgi:co-chaperonin GroES (HSP10)